MARAGADGFALTVTHFRPPPATFRHSNVPAVFRTPEPLQVPPDTSVTTVVVVLGVVVVLEVVVGNVVVVAGCVLIVGAVEPEHLMRPDVAFVFQDVAVFNSEVFDLPFAFAAADVKFFDCCVCETKYFDL